MRYLVLLVLAMFVMTGCVMIRKVNTKAGEGIMKADAKFREKAW
jgi:uncharacterized protein YceK